MSNEQKIIDSWKVNAGNWIDIIETNGIESRRLITNQAIVEAIVHHKPATALDIGCGEGWLSKELAARGIAMSGVDIIPALVEKAQQQVEGHFLVASYEDLYQQRVSFPQLFDALVINFALIGKESTEELLRSLPVYLAPGGVLFIQTLHPHSRKQMDDYTSGWKSGSWDGLGDQFTQSYDWYFRTLEDWHDLLQQSGFSHVTTKEVMHPQNGRPLSVIFSCQVH